MLRKGASGSTTKYGFTWKYDLSVNPNKYYHVVDALRNHISNSSLISSEEKERV